MNCRQPRVFSGATVSSSHRATLSADQYECVYFRNLYTDLFIAESEAYPPI
jgi:hypothetical protein